MKQYIPLGRVISKSSIEKCGDRQLPVLSITMKDGLVLQDEKFKKRIASADAADYKVIPRGKLVQGIHIDEANFGIQDIVDEGIVSPAYKVWEVDSSIIYPKYLEMIMRSPRSISFYRSKMNGSVNRRGRMTDEDFLAMPIPFVNYEQQEKIVSIIRQTSSVIALYNRQLLALDTLIKARFVEMFGNCSGRRKLEEYSVLITKGASPKWQGIDYCDEGTLFITSENVREGYVDLSKRKYLPDEINSILPRSVLRRNDVLINIVGASIGRAAIFESDELANINQAVAVVRLKKDVLDLRFLITFLNSEEAQKAYSFMKKGGARDNLSLKNISDLMIPIATMEEQRHFSSFVSQIDKSKVAVQAALEKAQLLFDSLMQQYFG